jgi:DsbE subfamily thiol:disulfide oxidoreductase
MKSHLKNKSYKQSKNEHKNSVIRNWKIFAGFIAIVLVAFLLAKTNHAEAEAVEKAVIGKSVGDFALQDLNGKSIQLSDYDGKTVLINAWATWCPPCRAEMPDLENYYQLHRNSGFEILAINAGDTPEQAAAFVNSTGLSFTILLDQDLHVLEGLGINGFPTSILIDPDGIIRYIHIGMLRPADLELHVTPILKGE